MNLRIKEGRLFWQRVFGLLAESSPILSLASATLTLVEAGLAIAGLYLIKKLIDALTLQFADGTAEGADVFPLLALVTLTLILAAIAQSLGTLIRNAQSFVVRDHVDRRLQDRALAVDLAFYESPAYHDLLFRAKQAGPERPAQIVTNVLLGGRAAVYLVAIFGMIASIDLLLLPALFVSIGIILYVRLKFTRVLFNWQYERAQQERRANYLDSLMTFELFAKEVRIGVLGAYFAEAFRNIRYALRVRQLAIEKRRALADMIAAVIGALVFCGATAFLVSGAMEGSISVGDLVLFVLLFRRAETTGRDLIGKMSQLYNDRLYLEQLFRFLEVTPTINTPASPEPLPPKINEGLVFKGVSFRYPNSDRWALRDIDFTLAPTKVTGLIGANGSGKTSLIKLLCRLYDPDEGQITLDGVDIRSFELERYRQLFSVIFQDFAKYAEPAHENIHLGDVHRPYSFDEIKSAARKSGASKFLAELPQGYDTPLMRIFDEGRELSYGEWQRVALARTFYARAPFLVMDEPTSALDALIEAEIFDDFRTRLGDRAALVISHRLSTLHQADQCYVLEGGRIVENGIHENLINGNGLYAELFRKKRVQYGSRAELV